MLEEVAVCTLGAVEGVFSRVLFCLGMAGVGIWVCSASINSIEKLNFYLYLVFPSQYKALVLGVSTCRVGRQKAD